MYAKSLLLNSTLCFIVLAFTRYYQLYGGVFPLVMLLVFLPIAVAHFISLIMDVLEAAFAGTRYVVVVSHRFGDELLAMDGDRGKKLKLDILYEGRHSMDDDKARLMVLNQLKLKSANGPIELEMRERVRVGKYEIIPVNSYLSHKDFIHLQATKGYRRVPDILATVDRFEPLANDVVRIEAIIRSRESLKFTPRYLQGSTNHALSSQLSISPSF